MNKIGFGFLRLPEDKQANSLQWEAVDRMVDAFLAAGGVWFDTCYTYMDGMSEEAVRRCVAARKDRSQFKLIEKLPGYLCHSYEDCQRYFREEQRRCGTDRFDVYMLHWLNQENYEIAEKYDQFRFLREVKEAGLADRIGFSYHDGADLLDEILSAHPEVDVVLLQINYLDWDSAGIESRKCYETAVRHGKSVFVMEPVKGGTLAKLPPKAERILKEVHPDWSAADWALGFVQSLPGVELCLSGMGELAQVEANMKQFAALGEREAEENAGSFAVLGECEAEATEAFVQLGTREAKALKAVCRELRSITSIPCTGCRYCVSHCPQGIAIPDYFSMYNELQNWPEEDWKIGPVYEQFSARHARLSACIECGSCEAHCPQHITVPEWVRKVERAFASQE